MLMHAFLLRILAILLHALTAQWTITSAPNNGAWKDDICLIGPDTGWVAGGADGIILRTFDGGETWQTVYTGADHLRSIGFAATQIGSSGSVSGTFLRTLDGGDTWQDITESIPGASSIHDLCAASPEVIYGCGVWFQPTCVIRSTNGGMNWDKTNLNSMASALIDVLFLNADTGFASGKAQPPSLGGIMLAAADGGDTWSVRHLTGHHDDHIWKLQTPDSIHIYGSVEAVVGTGTRIVRSSDAGSTWTTQAVKPLVPCMLVMGFLDTLHGFVGGDQILLETHDGRQSWQSLPLDAGYDRFHRISATEAFMCGNGVFRNGDASVGIAPTPPAPVEWLDVQPNPATSDVRATLHAHRRSQAELTPRSEQGQGIRLLYKGGLLAGERRFTVPVYDLAAGNYYVVLRTNQGQSTAAFTRQ